MHDNDILVAVQAIGNRHPELGLSLRRVAALLGVNAGHLSRVANGRRPATDKLADAGHWMAALAAAGVPAEQLGDLESAVKRSAASRPRRAAKPTYAQLEAMLRMSGEEYAERTSTVGPSGDRFAGPYAGIAVAAVAAALEAGLGLSAETDDGAMVDAGTDQHAVQVGPVEYFVECRGGGRNHQETVSSDPRTVAAAFVEYVGGSAAINAVVEAREDEP